MATVSVLLLLLFSAFSPPVHSRLTTFHVIPPEMNQTEAQEACRKNYTDLVTVYSDEDNTELAKLVIMDGTHYGWIGLYRSEKWSNGDPVTFRNWTGDCGNSWPCCGVMNPDGSWESLQCTVTRYFMCYEQDASSQNHSYHLIFENKTWYEAQLYCRGSYTDLVSIRDQQQNEEVAIKGLNSSTSFWIGLLCDDWQWADGGNSAYRNWGSGEPHPSPYDCVIQSGGKWHSWSCTDLNPALCYSTSSIHVSDVALSWEKALDYCHEGNRAGILNIDSEAEQEEVESALRKRRVSEPLWVGLRQSRLFGFWVWANGKAVFPYSNWDERKQPEHGFSQHCGAIDPQKHYKWRDMNCQSHYRALCHIKRSEILI